MKLRLKTALLFSITLLINATPGMAQDKLVNDLVSQYESYKEPSLNKRRIKHEDLQPLIDRYKNQAGITVTKVGESIEGEACLY